MDLLDSLLARVKIVNEEVSKGTIFKDSLERREDAILDLQREQLFAGIASDGQYIRPFYSEDIKPRGYFKNREEAARYAQWKMTLSYPSAISRMNDDAPNLYINGRFHSELGAGLGEEAITIDGKTSYARGIVNKYGITTFGLTTENWERLFRDFGVVDEIIEKIKNKLYGY